MNPPLTFRPKLYLRRTCIDAGAALRPLLQELVSAAVSPVYVGQLVAAFDAEIDAPTLHQRTQFSAIPVQPLIEPLSDLELQIIQLLADRRTNAEIALAFTVSVNKVKMHLQHIYEKLGVRDRRTAVVGAREPYLNGSAENDVDFTT
jgi:LuxR family maltose regulon positive regulatory protein